MSKFILAYINNSIGNKDKHFKLEGLLNIFNNKKEFNELEKYAIDIIQNDIQEIELLKFINENNISKENLDFILNSKLKYKS